MGGKIGATAAAGGIAAVLLSIPALADARSEQDLQASLGQIEKSLDNLALHLTAASELGGLSKSPTMRSLIGTIVGDLTEISLVTEQAIGQAGQSDLSATAHDLVRRGLSAAQSAQAATAPKDLRTAASIAAGAARAVRERGPVQANASGRSQSAVISTRSASALSQPSIVPAAASVAGVAAVKPAAEKVVPAAGEQAKQPLKGDTSDDEKLVVTPKNAGAQFRLKQNSCNFYAPSDTDKNKAFCAYENSAGDIKQAPSGAQSGATYMVKFFDDGRGSGTKCHATDPDPIVKNNPYVVSVNEFDNKMFYDRYGWSWGLITVPIKAYAGKYVETNSTAAVYFGFHNIFAACVWRGCNSDGYKNWTDNLEVSPVLLVGATAISSGSFRSAPASSGTPATGAGNTTPNQSGTTAGYSLGYGLIVNLGNDSNFHLGLVGGWDFVGTDSAKNFKYQGKPWYSVSVGYSLGN